MNERDLTEMRRAARFALKLWWLQRPIYEAAVFEYRSMGRFDDANGLSEVMHQYDLGNPIIGSDYRGLP